METILEHLPIESINTEWSIIRSEPDLQDPDFEELVNSIQKDGQLSPILIRTIKESDGSETLSLINGLRRLTAMKYLGYKTIQCTRILGEVSDMQALCLQLKMNETGKKNSSYELRRHIARLIELDPKLDINKLASSLSKSSAWVRNLMEISKLPESILKMVDSGKITLGNAFLLTKIADSDVEQFVDDACKLTVDDFSLRVKEYVFEKRGLYEHPRTDNVYKVFPKYLTLSTIKAELEKPLLLANIEQELKNRRVTNVMEILKEGLRAAIQMDCYSYRKRTAYKRKIVSKEEEFREKVKKKASIPPTIQNKLKDELQNFVENLEE